MNILAVDYGEKNIGLAFADSDIKLPLSLPPLRVESETDAMREIEKIVKEKNIQRIVFGLPLTFQFEETEACEKIRKFSRKISGKLGIQAAFVNEVLTSTLAARLKESSRETHSSSALIILEDYLNRFDEHLSR